MQYNKVFIEHFSYALPDQIVSTREIEGRLSPIYNKLRIPQGQLEALTGIQERRWWPKDFLVSDGATLAANKAVEETGFNPKDIDVLIYAGVCRDYYEPATACRIGAMLGLSSRSSAFDISNACLGVMNGIIDIANRIELGQIRAGLVVSCETSRDITEDTIAQLEKNPHMELFKTSLATFTGGSGAVAVLITDGSFNLKSQAHKLIGGASRSSLEHHKLCRWGVRKLSSSMLEQFANTDAVGVLKYGLDLGVKTFNSLLKELGWCKEAIDKVISHQVGKGHRDSILASLGLSKTKDYPSYERLGNMGTVSLPLTAALAYENGFLRKGDQVGLLGIGSGLNCLMMGVDW